VLADQLKKESEWETLKAAIKAKLDFGQSEERTVRDRFEPVLELEARLHFRSRI